MWYFNGKWCVSMLQKHSKPICMHSGRLKTHKNDAYHVIWGVLKNDLKKVSTLGDTTLNKEVWASLRPCIFFLHRWLWNAISPGSEGLRSPDITGLEESTHILTSDNFWSLHAGVGGSHRSSGFKDPRIHGFTDPSKLSEKRIHGSTD